MRPDHVVRALRVALADGPRRPRGPLALVALALACGCPVSSVAKGARVSPDALVRALRGGRSAVGLSGAVRLSAWVEYACAVHALAFGGGSPAEVAHAMGVAHAVGCDVGAWGGSWTG